MGYSTEFTGEVSISPPLSAREVSFLREFAASRRCQRRSGVYSTHGGSNPSGMDVIDINEPAHGQPGLWCQWVPTEDGTALGWDGGEKFYEAEAWMRYLIEEFLAPGAHAKWMLPFLSADHILTGTIYAQGEDAPDRWTLIVQANRVERVEGHRGGDAPTDAQRVEAEEEAVEVMADSVEVAADLLERAIAFLGPDSHEADHANDVLGALRSGSRIIRIVD